MKDKFRILALNPGSTSTKVAVYDNEEPILQETVFHSADDLSKFKQIFEQFSYRKNAILKAVEAKGIDLKTLDAVSGRGGNMGSMPSGTYRVNEAMLEASYKAGPHPSCLGPIIADDLAKTLGIEAFTVDPVCVDEMDDIARYSGWPELPRLSGGHPLNQKAIGRKAAADLGKRYDECNFIIAHMGGGISVGAHRKGRIVDINSNDVGLFTPERGYPPIRSIVDAIYAERYTKEEVYKMFGGKGGLYAYLGTTDGLEIEKMIEAGNALALKVYEAMAYQVSKVISALAVPLMWEVDAVLLTGGLSRSDLLQKWIGDRVKKIAPVMVYPGEKELEALAFGALRILRGEEKETAFPPAGYVPR